jgi:elongation factor P--(R)-beta-lysine ligase
LKCEEWEKNTRFMMVGAEVGTGNLELLRIRHRLLRAIRDFFYERGYLEVETPNLVKNPPPDPHIDPVAVYIGEKGPYYLHTSPEMSMKKLLVLGGSRIFQICKVYRVEELEEVHNTEFTMLEWYREGSYVEMMDEVADLVETVAARIGAVDMERFRRPHKVYTVRELCFEILGFDPLSLDRQGFLDGLRQSGFAGVDEEDTWNDLFFKVLIQETEGRIKTDRPCFVKDWPAAISTMAKRIDENRVERFELYVDGLEIANGYTELTDACEQRDRFERDNAERRRRGKRTFQIDEPFLQALAGLKGSYAGVSVGVGSEWGHLKKLIPGNIP